jgi:predicted small lipoprotein YifL
MSSGPRVFRALLMLVATIALAACGGGDSATLPPTTRPAQPTPAPSPTFEPGHEPLPIVDIGQVEADTGCPVTPYTSSTVMATGDPAI